MTRRGVDALLELLWDEGVRHIFGNPGTTELPVMDALAGTEDPAYVLALQEATAVGMADGYAQATGRPAFLNLHTSAGLGNAIGNLTNAQANGTPLVVTAGQQDRRHLHHDPLLAGDLVGLAASVSTWTHEVHALHELGPILRRAFLDAATPPTGPVFVSIPMDVLDEQGDAPVPIRSQRDTRVVAAGADELVERLAAAPEGNLALVLGDEVARSGGVDAAVALAEHLACPVFGSPLFGSTVFPTAHPLWRNGLPPSADGIAKALSGFDTVLLVGGRAFMVYPWSPGPAVPARTALLHVSPDAAQLGRTWPTELGLVGDPRSTLEVVLERLRPLLPARIEALARATTDTDATRARFEDRAAAAYGDVPMNPAAVAHALLRALPPGTAVVDEAITTGAYVRSYHHTTEPGRYFFARGGGLGWGMPAACGVSLGYDRAPVLAVVGDGSAMYSPQALWTAARQQLPVVFAVVDNGRYRILADNLADRGGPAATTGRTVGMDLGQPEIDFVALATSMGVGAHLVEKADDVGDAVRAALATGGPSLLHLPIAG